MPMPRVIVLTNAPVGTTPAEYLTDRDKFPAEPLFTTDVAKARSWQFPPGCRRYVKRHADLLPILKDCRRVYVGEDVIEAARGTVTAPKPRRGSRKPGRTPGKLNPNKRAKRATAKPGTVKRREVRKLSRVAATSRPPKVAKVA